MRPDLPVTAESVAHAKAENQRERQEVTRVTGLRFREDGTVIPESQQVRKQAARASEDASRSPRHGR